jgi:hypothetical protein
MPQQYRYPQCAGRQLKPATLCSIKFVAGESPKTRELAEIAFAPGKSVGYEYFMETLYQWEFQDPKMEVLYHIRPYFVVIIPYIGLI